MSAWSPRASLVRYYRVHLYDFAKAGPYIVRHHTSQTPTCKPGCAYCCYAKILVSVSDGVLIYLYLRDRWSAALEQRLVDADRAMTAATHAEWLGQQRPCAFLEEEGRGQGSCSIYPVRPVCCAGTFSIVADPADCGVPGGKALMHIVGEQARDVFGVLHADIAKAYSQDRTWCTTLPGAVLCGRALVEERPMPEGVLRVALENIRDSKLDCETLFDRLGKRRAQVRP